MNQIEILMRQMEAKINLLQESISAKDTEFAELKASLSQAQQMYTDLLVGTTDAIAAKDAEIKQLRDFANQCFKSPEKLVVIHYFENGEFDYCDLVPLQDAATNALSPAPVTGGYSIGNYPKITLEQLTETDDMTMMQRLKKQIPPFHRVEPVTEQCPDILQTILALPDDTSAAYIKSMIHDQLKRA